MSLIIIPQIINKITDPKGNVLFKYPGETLLDQINTDLWSLIIKFYWSNISFALGNRYAKYSEFRIITIEECDKKSFFKSFTGFYNQNKGLYLLSDHSYSSRIIIASDIYFCINDKLCYIHEKDKESIAQIHDDESVITTINSISWAPKINWSNHDLQLFVQKDAKFRK